MGRANIVFHARMVSRQLKWSHSTQLIVNLCSFITNFAFTTPGVIETAKLLSKKETGASIIVWGFRKKNLDNAIVQSVASMVVILKLSLAMTTSTEFPGLVHKY
jgi:hypothetical protein